MSEAAALSSASTADVVATDDAHQCHGHGHGEQNESRSSLAPPPHQRTYIARLILGLQDALQRLLPPHSNLDLMQLEHMAVLIFESMANATRNYHSVQHVFDVVSDVLVDDPLLVLAAYFHDVVYVQVDGGLPDVMHELLQDITLKVDDSGGGDGCVYVAGGDQSNDSLLRLVERIFGYHDGQRVTCGPGQGLNEFLSAIVCVRCLQPLLPTPQLALLAVCIEATIPFRPVVQGDTPMDRLYDKFRHVNNTHDLQLSAAHLVRAVQRAVRLTHQDLHNFGTTDLGYFIDNTWMLLPETNAGLRHAYLYTVRDFQVALFKMYGFFQFLQPNVVFWEFHGIPNASRLHERTANAARNLSLGREYVAAKLLALSVLTALAELTGGANVPIALFMGDLPQRQDQHGHYNSDEPAPTAAPPPRRQTLEVPAVEELHADCHQDVFDLLALGRRSDSDFDIRQSPLAAFWYAALGPHVIANLLGPTVVVPMTTDRAQTLLSSLPMPASAWPTIARNIAVVAKSRADLILAVVDKMCCRQQPTFEGAS